MNNRRGSRRETSVGRSALHSAVRKRKQSPADYGKSMVLHPKLSFIKKIKCKISQRLFGNNNDENL